MATLTAKSKPLWRGVFVLSLLAALFSAVFKSMDNITVHHFAVAEDGLTAAFSYLVVGGWTGFFSSLLFAMLIGKRLLDPDYNGIVLRNRRMHRQALIAGAISAGSTLFLLWGNQLGDPSMLIALGSAGIVYNVLYDSMTGQVSFKRIIAPMLLVLLGSIMASQSGSLFITMTGFLFVVVISNGLNAFSEVIEQDGARASDGVNLFIWRFFWLAFTGTILAVVMTTLRGYTDMWLTTMQNLIMYLPWVIATMFFVFLGIGLKLVIKKTNTVSVVLLIMSVQIVLGYPITLIGNVFVPGLFGTIPTEISVWLIRALGALFLICGIVILRKNDPNVTE